MTPVIDKRYCEGLEHNKDDERIVVESDFVAEILSQTNEKCERNCELRNRVIRLTATAPVCKYKGYGRLS